MTTTVRKDIEALTPDTELLVEVLEDNPTSNRVSLTLLVSGPQGKLATGKVNLGQVFRKQTRHEAESLADAILGFLRETDDVVSAPVETTVKANLTARAAGTQVPMAVKDRSPTAKRGAIELDHLSRKDLAATLRKLADRIEVRDEGVEFQQLDLTPIKGGGTVISMTVSARG